MAKVYKRSKKVYATARSAWMNVAKKTGLRPAQVKSQHTSTHWVWKTRK